MITAALSSVFVGNLERFKKGLRNKTTRNAGYNEPNSPAAASFFWDISDVKFAAQGHDEIDALCQ